MANSQPNSHRITQFFQWHKENVLDLSPRFQRNPVWSHKNKSYLIDTILNGYPVPEIFLQIETSPDGQTKYSVVDGQQRIRSIIEFIEGEYEILESESNREFGGKEFKDLPDGIKKDFWDYRIITRELDTSSEDEVTTVFKRMNKYVFPLNPQELRNATYRGHFIELINQLAEEDYWADNKIVSAQDIRRMMDSEFISDLIISMLHGIQTKKTETINGYYKMYDDEFDDEETTRKKVRTILNKLDEILGDLRPTRWHRKHEFYSLFVALSFLLDEYQFPPEQYNEIKKVLCSFSDDIDKGKSTGNSKINIMEFIKTVTDHTTNKDERVKRTNIVRELIIPFLIAKDPTRDFTEEERRIAWNLSEDKKCHICNNEVTNWNDYHLDHIISHSKGGKTELRNSQITHNICNQSKSNK